MKKKILNVVLLGIIKSDKFVRMVFDMRPVKKSPFFIKKGVVLIKRR